MCAVSYIPQCFLIFVLINFVTLAILFLKSIFLQLESKTWFSTLFKHSMILAIRKIALLPFTTHARLFLNEQLVGSDLARIETWYCTKFEWQFY